MSNPKSFLTTELKLQVTLYQTSRLMTCLLYCIIRLELCVMIGEWFFPSELYPPQEFLAHKHELSIMLLQLHMKINSVSWKKYAYYGKNFVLQYLPIAEYTFLWKLLLSLYNLCLFSNSQSLLLSLFNLVKWKIFQVGQWNFNKGKCKKILSRLSINESYLLEMNFLCKVLFSRKCLHKLYFAELWVTC